MKSTFKYCCKKWYSRGSRVGKSIREHVLGSPPPENIPSKHNGHILALPVALDLIFSVTDFEIRIRLVQPLKMGAWSLDRALNVKTWLGPWIAHKKNMTFCFCTKLLFLDTLRILVILRPDKVNGVVLLDRTDYLEKVEKLLSDTSKFKKLDTDILDLCLERENRLVK